VTASRSAGPVDGSDPATEWRGYHSLEEPPRLTNPPTGWMQNSNTTPFLLTSSGNPDASRFPPYMVTEGDNFRGLASRRILAGTPRFTWEEWVRAAFDSYVAAADSLLPGLLRDAAGIPRLAPAIEVLARWDRRSDTASVAMTLFDRWREALQERREMREGGAVLVALDTAMARLERDWGTWRVPWGEVNRLQRIDEPSSSSSRTSVPASRCGEPAARMGPCSPTPRARSPVRGAAMAWPGART
jgi:acyl-homoserine lactone acylase PvdQ